MENASLVNSSSVVVVPGTWQYALVVTHDKELCAEHLQKINGQLADFLRKAGGALPTE